MEDEGLLEPVNREMKLEVMVGWQLSRVQEPDKARSILELKDDPSETCESEGDVNKRCEASRRHHEVVVRAFVPASANAFCRHRQRHMTGLSRRQGARV